MLVTKAYNQKDKDMIGKKTRVNLNRDSLPMKNY